MGSPKQRESITAQGGEARPCAGLEQLNADENGGNVAQIGRLLFIDYVWPFEVTSVLLVVAAIGAIVLGKRNESLSELVDVGTANAPGVPHMIEGATAAGELSEDTDDDDTTDETGDLAREGQS